MVLFADDPKAGTSVTANRGEVIGKDDQDHTSGEKLIERVVQQGVDERPAGSAMALIGADNHMAGP